jgi:hypothetical protein
MVVTLFLWFCGGVVFSFSEPDPETGLRLIVCGDFNGGPECGAVRYLEDGMIDSTFLEDGEPVTSKRKELPLPQPLVDVATMVQRGRRPRPTDTNNDKDDNNTNTKNEEELLPPPPTLVVPELISSMVQPTTMDDDCDGRESTVYGSNVRLSNDMVDRLTRIYHRLARSSSSSSSTTTMMNVNQVQEWLVTINGKLGRGDEYREAARQMGWTDPSSEDPQNDNEKDGDQNKDKGSVVVVEESKTRIELPTINKDGSPACLTLEGFIEVYQKELQAGKFWGIAHDCAVLGDPLPDVGTFTARYDRMYYTSTALEPIAVLDTISDLPCPNDTEPSDHLPVAACFRVKTSITDNR